jgi:hypothetical protein
VLLGRVVVEMHRCWDVLGLVGSTGLDTKKILLL